MLTIDEGIEISMIFNSHLMLIISKYYVERQYISKSLKAL